MDIFDKWMNSHQWFEILVYLLLLYISWKIVKKIIHTIIYFVGMFVIYQFMRGAIAFG